MEATLPERIKRGAYWLLSRVLVAGYARFPVFGPLRGSVGICRRGDQVLVLERSDGRGLSFPGGLAWPWESDESVLVREMLEETGLRVTSHSLLVRYRSDVPYPTRVTAYQVEATGELRSSWEGAPQWLSLNEIESRIIVTLQPALTAYRDAHSISHRPGTNTAPPPA